ncbi:hypothetical protein [Parachitinimonas caeni]|uniref:Uncharacterized protein n=1 Tax=Parachitinimonas caeni TaxID=3031301 RepID=A0ABT7DTP6_9NEIS|nr:hypothetical protein [Parachitinimonas caeni]MDK2123438.1 hypothetical protein [Parachitinimonas caeni]
MVRKLQLIVGKPRGNQTGVPEPDGLGDLRRRGPYERLLTSEWLLAEEIPDEFLRRAAGGEHLFLSPVLRQLQAESQLVALFDVGPLQLGAPRLAHVAFWILLARRASEAGGSLRWGVLQEPGRLHDADNLALLKHMLGRRSWLPACADDLVAWQQTLTALTPAMSETWLLASNEVTGAAFSHQVTIKPSLAEDKLLLTLREGQATKTLQLDLPPTDSCKQVLAGQLEPEAEPTAHSQSDKRFSLKRPPIIAPDGAYVAVVVLDEPALLMLDTTFKRKDAAVKLRRMRWNAGAPPLAIALRGKKPFGVVPDGEQISFWQLGQFPTVSRPQPERFNLPPGLASWSPLGLLKGSGRQQLHLLDRLGNHLFWEASFKATPSARTPAPGITHYLRKNTLAMVQIDDTALLVAHYDEQRRIVAMVQAMQAEPLRQAVIAASSEAPTVLFGELAGWRSNGGLCALGTGNGQRWDLYAFVAGQAQCRATLHMKPESQVLGVLLDAPSSRYLLLTVAPNKRGLVLLGQDYQERVYDSPNPISRITFCDRSGLVAMLTDERELIVFDLRHRRLRRFVGSAGNRQPATSPRFSDLPGAAHSVSALPLLKTLN